MARKRIRLPNGFGQISQIKGKRLRKPWRAMVTVGKTETGRPICKLLKPESYFETYNDAYAALLEYNKNPYDLEPSITVEELYQKWSSEYFKNISPSAIRTIKMAWSHSTALHSMEVKAVRVRHFKNIIENAPSAVIASKIKSLMNIMFDYAVEYEIVEKNYARDFKVERPDTTTEHMAFSDAELNTLWENINDYEYIDAVLIQTYMGWRPQELCNIKCDDVDLTNMTIRGGMKTKSGKNRLVPIPTKIKGIVEIALRRARLMKSAYLIVCSDASEMTYDKYNKRFKKLMSALHLNSGHRAHDPRKTFVTLCKNKGVDEYAIKYIVGHVISDLTERVYTERNIEWLRQEIEKLS